MKKLADFKDEEAIVLWGNLFQILAEMAEDEKTIEAMKSGNKTKMIACLTNEHPDIAMKLLRLLSEKGDEYHCTAGSVLKDVMELFNDEDLLQVFYSQG